MGQTVLVTYASKYGATAEIAQKIGEVLAESGLDTEVLSTDSVGELSRYGAVVLGSGVYIGRWRKQAVQFLKKHSGVLASLPVWLFSSGPTGKGDPVELLDGWKLPKALQPVVDSIKPLDVVVFHGVLIVEKLTAIERWIINKVKAPFGDLRDWQSITSWAVKIAAALRTQE